MSWLFWYTIASAALAAVILKIIDTIFSGVTGGVMLVLKPFAVAATWGGVFGGGGLRKVTSLARVGRGRNKEIKDGFDALQGKGR